MISEDILEKLICFTDEEIDNLNGKNIIDKSIYMNDRSNVIDYSKILMDNQQISVRKHTRFIEYPGHRHNYLELMYVYGGNMTHIIDDREITIQEGELLLLNQNIEHSIQYTNENDIIFNFIIKPEFLEFLSAIVEKENEVVNFVFDALYSYNNNGEYLLFKVNDNNQVKTYIESIVTHIYQPTLNNELELKLLIGLLLTELMNHPENIITYSRDSYDKLITSRVLKYISHSYKNANLQDISMQLGIPDYKICKIIKKTTGKTFKQLLQDAKFEKVIHLIVTTPMTIEQIIEEVGYENESYFYRIFKKKYNMTPNQFRVLQEEGGKI